jgi:hypothetical protein
MANVNYPDFVCLNRPENKIRISTDWHAANCLSSGRSADAGVLADGVHRTLDRKLHVDSAARTAFVKVVQDIYRSFCARRV